MMNQVQNEVKKPKKFRPNIIDFLVVIAIIAAIAGIVIRSGFAKEVAESVVEQNTPVEEVYISFLIRDINKDSGSAFVENAEFKAANFYYTDLGYLEKAEVTRADYYFENRYGEMIKTKAPLADENDPESYKDIDVRGTLVSKGKFDENGFFLLDGIYPITPGTDIRLANKDIDVMVTVIDVNKK